MREHAYLAAMVGFVTKHVAQHLRADRPGLSPAVSAKHLHAALATERFIEHLLAASGALGQSRAGLPRRAVRAVELWWNLQVRSRKPDPLAADIVHVGEDRRNGADLAWRFRSPGARIKMFDEKLVDAIVGGKDLDRASAVLSVNPVLTRGHGSLLLEQSYFRRSDTRKQSTVWVFPKTKDGEVRGRRVVFNWTAQLAVGFQSPGISSGTRKLLART
jgi:hypothetical protein